MNSLDEAVAAALHSKADGVARAVDTAQARAAVEARLDRVDHHRRRRVWLVPLAVGTVATAVAVIVFAGRDLHQAGPLPPTHPSPGPPMFTLPADPFMTDQEVAAAFPPGNFARDAGAVPRQLSPCLTDPRGWGAAQSEVATYTSRTDPAVTLNEYVLRFGDPSAADRALMAAWAAMNSCRHPARGAMDPPDRNFDSNGVDDIFVDKVPHADRHAGLYELFVVRMGMVVVVIEDTDFPREEGGSVSRFFPVPLSRAIPGATRFYAPACVEHPQPCTNPLGFD